MSDRSTKPKPRVVIVGGGFGGLSTAKGLADAPFDIFRSRFWERLAVNVGIVLVFGAFYWRFLRPP